MAHELLRYDAACRALAQARATDEVLKIRDQAAMLRTYAKQAKNRELEITAAEIRIRAERRVGELIAAQKNGIGLHPGGRPSKKKTTSVSDVVLPKLSDAGIDVHLADRARKLAAVPPKQFETRLVDWRSELAQSTDRVSAAILGKRAPHVTHNAKDNNEWYTPAEYVEAARRVLGEIDLDPASCAAANAVIQAGRIFTVETDGLEADWIDPRIASCGRVWMNPPYLHPEIERFTSKLVAYVRAGEVEAAIVLVNNATETAWFHTLAGDADAICLKRGRISFQTPGRESATPLQGQVFLYFGGEPASFRREFEAYGLVFEPSMSVAS